MELSSEPEVNGNESYEDSETKENRKETNRMEKETSDNTKPNKSKKMNKRAIEKSADYYMKLNSIDVSEEDLEKLCKHISMLNERIRGAREITYLRYKLPGEMRDKLEVEAMELECFYAELQDAKRNLEAIQAQRAAVGKERLWMETQINKLKADAVNEMEMIVSVYDSNMMEKWETVKQTDSVPSVENFLHDVKGKLEAMKNLQVLASNKLTDLQSQEKKKAEIVSKKEKKRMNREERGGGGGGGGPTRTFRNSSNTANSSQTSLPFLLDTDSDDLMDEGTVQSVLYSLMYDQVLNLPAWTQTPLDID